MALSTPPVSHIRQSLCPFTYARMYIKVNLRFRIRLFTDPLHALVTQERGCQDQREFANNVFVQVASGRKPANAHEFERGWGSGSNGHTNAVRTPRAVASSCRPSPTSVSAARCFRCLVDSEATVTTASMRNIRNPFRKCKLGALSHPEC